MDTIFAEATAPGKAGVAIIRVSGPHAFYACRRIAGDVPAVRSAVLRSLRRADGDLIDHGLVLVFAAAASFTGEDVVEFQVHGSRAVCADLEKALGDIPGLRPAAAGEFTRRALDNDRLDLTQVEGLADLIDAETEVQRRQAQRAFRGEVSSKVLEWRENMIHAAALIEASIDFADEDVPVDIMPDVIDTIRSVRSGLRHELDGYGVSERIRSGFEVAILGPPNAGKSTLLNTLANREVALTSKIAGTTRDIIELRTDLGGLPVTFLDTAGLRVSEDPLERAGIAKGIDRAKEADLRVFLTDGSIMEGLEPSADDIVLRGKSDLVPGDISGLTGDGVDRLIGQIRDRLAIRMSGASSVSRERHAQAMTAALDFLSEAECCIRSHEESEIVALTLRNAIMSLEDILGRVDVEDLLGDIFSRFCIGK